MKCIAHNKGFVVILSTILVLSAGLVIVLSAGYISLSNIRAVRNNIYSAQAYYAAEAGIEDSLLRLLDPDMQDPDPDTYSLTVGGAEVTLNTSKDPIGGSYTIISDGDKSNRIRTVKVVLTITTTDVSFHYGAQAGEGGMTMENNSRVKGNVFSNGNIIAPGHRGYIDNTAKVATTEKEIHGLIIGDDAYAHNCEDCTIGGDFYYSGGEQDDCTVTGDTNPSPVQETGDMPVSNEQIVGWKDAADDDILPPGDYVVPGGETGDLGPNKIQGNLILENGSTLIVTGTLWVTGDITIGQGALIELDSSTYGSVSGIIIADGKIDVQNGAQIQGSGEEGSYTMLLSTNNSQDLGDPAIDVKNNVQGAIFYANNGLIRLRNSMEIQEATGYAIHLDNMAVIEYESGLADATFSSGPGAGYGVEDWQEIE